MTLAGRPETLAAAAAERAGWGAALAEAVPAEAHATWRSTAARRDPVAVLQEAAASRVQELVPILWGRMAETPFTFFRGAAAIMAADLATLPTSRLHAQCSGDAHLSNFGVFAAPDRRLVFDLNDFDQSTPAPVEWDLKRLVASCVIAAHDLDAGDDEARAVAHAAAESYRRAMWRYAAMRHVDVYYSRVEVDGELSILGARADKTTASRVRKDLAKAQKRTSLGSLQRFAERGDGGEFRLRAAPPILEPVDPGGVPQLRDLVAEGFAHYTATLGPDRAAVLRRYRFVDAAAQVVGVGSVGLRAYMLLFMGDRDDDPLFLQLKEARPSVLAPYVAPSGFAHEGERVVHGQRMMQTAGDAFLGWIDRPADAPGPDFYVRQLRDQKGSIKIARITQPGLVLYAEECGAVLARAHARSGDAAQLAGYLGTGPAFSDALTEFAVAYAEQNRLDHEALLQAEADGRIEVRRGV